jgi:mRNA-degrading endonuclease RelE of RelBE toxin-antitoxin system
MTTPWLTTMKPTFQTEWLALPAKEGHQILEKINLLSQDPTPDAKVKKQLKYLGGKLHRLRSGNYRIFYTFEHPYVSLLALRRRDDDTYDEEIDADFLGGLDPNLANITKPHQPDWEKLFASPQTRKTKLPEPITKELLENLRIPESCHQRLMRIETREDLFDCPGIPDEIILKLDEYLFERSLVEVLQQPDFLTGDVDNLLRFKEGDLLGFLLKLSPEQEKFVTWAMNASGPTLLKGGPGTGKSTVALYRVRAIINTLKASPPQLPLSRGESGRTPKILFTTYTNALVAFSQQLLASLLGDDIQYVEVKTADAIAYSIICHATGQPNIAKSTDLQKLLKQALPKAINSLLGNLLQRQAQAQILERLNIDYLIEEINTVIEAREITTLEVFNHSSHRTSDRPQQNPTPSHLAPAPTLLPTPLGTRIRNLAATPDSRP